MDQLDKLLDAWRADPRVDATVELGNMLLRANVKAKGALPRSFIVQFGDDAARRHGSQLGVLDILARLFAVSGEGARAQATYARAASLFPGDARVVEVERALREAGLAVPPPEVAARLAPPPSRGPPARSELPPPRAPMTSLSQFAPHDGPARPFPIEGGLLDAEPSTSDGGGHGQGSLQAPAHVPDAPTREMSSRKIEEAIGDEAIPRRQRAPTVAGLGMPAPPLPTDASADAAVAPTPMAARAFPAPSGSGGGGLGGGGPASPLRMFTPARAFTPPPGGLAWSGARASAPSPPAPAEESLEPLRDWDTATEVQSPARRVIIDAPTTDQDTLTKPGPMAPATRPATRPAAIGSPGSAQPFGPPARSEHPPTQTRLVPEQAQLRAAAASIVARPPPQAGGLPPGPLPGAPQPALAPPFATGGGPGQVSRPAARRAVPLRDRRRDADDDGQATGVTSLRSEAHDADGGQATARRDTSELLAAALLPRSPGASPALGAPDAGAVASRGSVPPPRAAEAAAPRPPTVPPIGRPGAPQAKPTLISRAAPSGPVAKPTLVSPGGRAGGRPQAASLPQLPTPTADEPSRDETDTEVRALAPQARSLFAAATRAAAGLPPQGPPLAPTGGPQGVSPGAAPDAGSTFSRQITGLWDPEHGPPRPGQGAQARPGAGGDPRKGAPPHDADDDGPSTNVLVDGGRPAGASVASPHLPQIIDEPSFEEVSDDAVETFDEPRGRDSDAGDLPTGLVDRRAAIRSTQRLAGTVAPSVAWGPDAGDAESGGVRTKILTAEQSAQAGRIDPLPPGEPSYTLTPAPPTAPRFGPPPALPPASAGFGAPPSFGPPGFGSPGFGSPGFGMQSYPPGAGPPVHGMRSVIPPTPRVPTHSFPPMAPAAPLRAAPSPIVVGTIIGVAASLLLAGGSWLYSELSQPLAPSTTAAVPASEVEALVLVGRRAELDRADVLLRESPSGTDKERRMMRLRERALRALELGTVSGLTDAVAAARAAGWTDPEVAFAELAAAVATRDAAAAGVLAERWGSARSTDAFFVLAAAAAAELRGDRKALESYGAALGLEPRLRPAAVRIARAELLGGSEDRGVARIESLAAGDAAAPEVAALRGLAWIRARRATRPVPPRPVGMPAAEDLPVELRFVPDAMRLASGQVPASSRKTTVDEAVRRADTPAAAVLLGELALELRVESASLEIGRAQLVAHPAFAPALDLFASSALALAKLDAIDAVGKDLPAPQQNLLRAVVAYERGDVGTVLEVRSWLGDRDQPGREGIVARAERMMGRKKMPAERVQALQRQGVIGGDLVATDALLDLGDLPAARAIVESWGDASSHPLRALRSARLLRYEGKLAEAEAALDVAVPTLPALVERLLLEAESPDGRLHARSMLDARFGEDRLLYEAYLLALDGKVPAATKLLDGFPEVPEDAPRARRVAAALALSAIGDAPRARGLVRRLLADWPKNPDVARAARALADGPAKARTPRRR